MINIKSIKGLINDKKVCKLWLDPESLSPKQIRDTLKDFAGVISFDPDSKTDEDRVAGDIASLVEDVVEMNSISEEEKDEETLKYVNIYKKQLRSLAERAIKQINIRLKNYENEVLDKWLEGEYNPEALALLTNDITD